MMVNSPLELYATVIGIRLFDALFNILVSMGIAWLPLVILFFDNVTTPFESEMGHGAAVSLRRVMIRFFLWFFVLLLFVVPIARVDATAIKYTPVCRRGAVPSTFGDTGTTYDSVFANLDYNHLRLPLMMQIVLTGFSGVTNAAIVSLPCKTDVAAIQTVIDTTRLTPSVATGVERFQDECFAKARARFDTTPPSSSDWRTVLANYGGQTDLSWLGSHVLQTLYYNNLYPQSPVPGFAYAEYPGPYAAYNAQHGITHGQWGYPSCETWWNADTIGLKAKLVALASAHSPQNPHLGTLPLTDRLSAWLAHVRTATGFGSRITAQDIIARDMLYDVGANAGFGRFFIGGQAIANEPADMSNTPFHSMIVNTAALAGQTVTAALNTVDRAEIAQEIPIIQAILLAFALMLGAPIILVGLMSTSPIGVIFTYYFLVGSLFFMTFIERFVHYLELSLRASQSYSLYALGDSTMLYNVFTKLYFYAPILYLALMSIAGVGLGTAMGKAFDGSSSGEGGKIFSRGLRATVF